MLFIFGRNSGMLKIESETQLVVFNGMIGGFQLEFISISRVINHMTCYNFDCSHWWKIHLKKHFTRFALQSECCNFNQ